jgi:galactose mutarotase-like enzyme
MYLTMVKSWFSSLFGGFWQRSLMRSGMVTGLVLAVLVVGLATAYRERGRGHLHRLEAKIVPDREEAPVPQPGGQEAVVLTRTQLAGSATPEFLSVTMLPGRGMNVLQITAYIPDKGEVNLMASPTLEEAARAMNGTGADASGGASMAMGGAFEAPWAGSMGGIPLQGRVSTAWRGHTMTLPAAGTGPAASVAENGLILSRPADSSGTAAMPDGGQAQASFEAADFGAKWPSKTEITVTVLLSSRSIEFTVIAHNTGDVSEPIGIGWHPRFAILDRHRDQIKLQIPGQMREEVRDQQGGLPTGTLIPVAGTPYDFTAQGGAKLGTVDLKDTYVQLHRELLDDGPAAEFLDPADNYGLRMTALSTSVKAMRLEAPLNGNFVAIAPQFNYDDPFGREWSKEADTGMVVLQPGQSTQWKVRLELFALKGADSPI